MHFLRILITAFLLLLDQADFQAQKWIQCGLPRGFTISLLKPRIEPHAAQLNKLFGKPHKLKVSFPPRESQCWTKGYYTRVYVFGGETYR